LALGACSASHKKSSGTGGTDPSTGDPSTGGTPAVNEGPTQATEKGIITNFTNHKPVPNATVIAGDQTVTTAADGSYSFTLQKGEPFRLTVVADGYAKLIEQEATLDGDYDKGATTIVPTTMATLLTGMLNGYDSNLGVLSVELVPMGGCASEQGAEIEVSPAGSAKVAYMVNKLPSPTATSVTAGQFPSAVVYNVQPGVQLSLTVTHASCSEAPFPVQQGAVKYTGGISTESGQTTGFARVFLQ
jgi:hypothetical protein